MKTASFLALLTLAFSSLACAADLSARDPKELSKSLKSAKPGDVIVMQDGEWKDMKIEFSVDGTLDQPITLRAQTPGKVRLTGASRLRVAGSHLIVDGLLFTDGGIAEGHVIQVQGKDGNPNTGCRITNCAVIDYNPPNIVLPTTQASTQSSAAPSQGPPPGTSHYLSLWGTNHRVDRCYFRGKQTNGPTLVVWVENQPNDHQIDRNYFAHRPPLGRNGGETMRIGTSDVSMKVSRAVVEQNYFERCDGEAEIISNKSCENVYRGNTFVESQGCLTLRHGNRATVDGNFFFGNGREGTGGIRVVGEDHKIFNNYLEGLAGRDFQSAMPFVNGIPNSKLNEYFRVQRAIVCFNTFVNCAQNITFGIGHTGRNRIEEPWDVTLANNLIVTNAAKTPLICVQDTSHPPTRLSLIGNILFGGATDLGELATSDPSLLKGANDLWLAPAALTATDAGKFAFVKTDTLGRPLGGNPVVGAIQPSDAKSTSRPLTPNDVGPDWMRGR